MIFSQKSTLKDDIFSIIEKDDSHPKNMVFLLIDDEKVYFYKKYSNDSLYFYGDFISVLIDCFPMTKTRKRNI